MCVLAEEGQDGLAGCSKKKGLEAQEGEDRALVRKKPLKGGG